MVVVRGEEREPRHQAKDQTGAEQPEVRTVAADAGYRRRRAIEEYVRSPSPIPWQAARGVRRHHRRPVQDRSLSLELRLGLHSCADVLRAL
jgi:hypothetical protein